MLTNRYRDDADEVVTLRRLGVQMRGRAKDLRAMHRFENGVRHWVTSVVMPWADFPFRRVEHDGVIYVQGDMMSIEPMKEGGGEIPRDEDRGEEDSIDA